MENNKLETISNLFENSEIRSIWDSKKVEYFFSVVDVISALTDSLVPKRYWTDLKKKLIEEGSQLYENIVRLKMRAQDGKYRETDTLDTKGIFRLIESVPSKKAEPFKLWLASLGKERIDEVFDPEDVWKSGGIKKPIEYALLTNEIYKTWSGMKASEYKNYKGLRKESLRDMTDIEVLLTDLGEVATRDIAGALKPQGLKENLEIAKRGGGVAKDARLSYEKATNKSAISKEKALRYKYIEEKQIETKE